MNNQQVQAKLQQTQQAFGGLTPSAINVGEVVAFLQNGVAGISEEMQLAFDCLTRFKCRGFKVEEKMAAQIELAESLGLDGQLAALRGLVKEYEIAKADEER